MTSQINGRLISKESGLKFINCLTTLSKDRTIPLIVVNETNRHLKIYRHGLIARLSPVNESNIIDTCSVIKNGSTDNKIDLKDLHVPERYRNRIEMLVLKNKNLFASKNSKLGHTDTGDTKPIKLRPYRTPIKNRGH